MSQDAVPSPRAGSGTARTATDEVLLAMLPGLLALGVCFGWGTPVNLLWAVPVALAVHALGERWRGARWQASTARAALPAALVLAIALPPAAAWWLVAGSVLLATSVRHAARAAGFPRFNPAMAALAVALLLFPAEATRWIAPAGPAPLPAQPLGLLEALRAALGLLPARVLDGYTMATPLELLRHDHSHTIAEMRARHAQFGALGGRGWEWAGAGFLAGGAYLVWRRVAAWQAGAGMLLALLLLATLADDGSSASAGPPLLHLFGGGTLFAACFVLTEPHGAPRGAAGRLVFGALVGALSFALRGDGAFADGIAFAVLAANALVPLADGLDPGMRSAPTTAAPPWSRITGAAFGLAILYGGWHGLRAGEPRADDAGTDTLLRIAGAGPAALPRPFAIEDAVLLGFEGRRTAWRIRDASGTIAVVLPVRAPDGYAGPIDLLVGFDRAGVTTGVQVRSHEETPGIGDAIATTGGWIAGFGGRSTPRTDAISGATVSSRAVSAAVARASRHFGIHRATLLEGSATDASWEAKP